ncbi:MAG: DUF2244 domain-containing protein [Mangrovicoccus sp.]
MPYHWRTDTGEAPDLSGASAFHAQGDAPLARLQLTAHQSLSPKGFVIFIGASFALILVPLLAVLGTNVFWVLLIPMMAALAAIWWALKRSWRDRNIIEDLVIWSDRLELHHRQPNGEALSWIGNPYWVMPHMHTKRGPHRHYITLTGGEDGREVEIGSFLAEEERITLFPELELVISQAAMLNAPV